MDNLNQLLFFLFNALSESGIVTTFWGMCFIWTLPVGCAIVWPRAGAATRETLLLAMAAAVAGLLVNEIMAVAWQLSHPFTKGPGGGLMSDWLSEVFGHAFAGTQLTLLWAVGFMLLQRRGTRAAGLLLVLAGAPVARACIDLGTHVPIDVVTAMLAAACGAWLMAQATSKARQSVAGIEP